MPPASRLLRDLVEWHDLLLLQRAFPTDPAFHDETPAAPERAAGSIRRLARSVRAAADDSGIVGTTSRHTFDHGIATWLASSFPLDAEIDWADLGGAERLETMLRPLVRRAEEDAFEDLPVREWVRLARDAAAPSDLAWILAALRRSGIAARVVRTEWEAAAIPIRWRLRSTHGSVTGAGFAVGAPVIRRAMRPVPVRPMAQIAAPLPGIRLLARADAERMIDVARTALAARCREVYAISHANAAEVWHADLGAGTSLAVIGTPSDLRMSLEANYGYLLLSNGIPIGYGGVTPLFRQANTGINIFEPFRGAEAAFLWAQMLRAFRTLFGSRRFVVNAYQFGEGNREAIESGAFWFYHRLGFRPATSEVRSLAAAEVAHRKRDPRHRSSAATLRALASGDLHLTLPDWRADDAFDEAWLPTLAARATARLAAEGGNDRAKAVTSIARDVAHRLGVRPAGWRAAERRAFASLAPLAAALPPQELSHWPLRARRALAALFRQKAAPQERDFVRAAAAHPLFFRALRALARA